MDNDTRYDEYGTALTERNGYGQWVNSDGATGYYGHFGGFYICYTCGHLCECVDVLGSQCSACDELELVNQYGLCYECESEREWLGEHIK